MPKKFRMRKKPVKPKRETVQDCIEFEDEASWAHYSALIEDARSRGADMDKAVFRMFTEEEYYSSYCSAFLNFSYKESDEAFKKRKEVYKKKLEEYEEWYTIHEDLILKRQEAEDAAKLEKLKKKELAALKKSEKELEKLKKKIATLRKGR